MGNKKTKVSSVKRLYKKKKKKEKRKRSLEECLREIVTDIFSTLVSFRSMAVKYTKEVLLTIPVEA